MAWCCRDRFIPTRVLPHFADDDLPTDVRAQTPKSDGSSSAVVRHSSKTGHRAQMRVAGPRALPLVGNKRSDPIPRQAARAYQSRRTIGS
jgi:hypothetical protein